MALRNAFENLATESTASGIRTDLGTDGSTPPSIAGTGVRGWLRAIYDKLVSGIGRTWSLNSSTDSVEISGTVIANTGLSQPLTDTQLRAVAVPVSVSGVSTESTLSALKTVTDNINTATAAIKLAVESINSHTVYSDTNNISGFIKTGAMAEIPDSSSSNVYFYFCDAQPGTLSNAAAWRIYRTELSTGRKQWADGNANFDNIADNRVSLTYI